MAQLIQITIKYCKMAQLIQITTHNIRWQFALSKLQLTMSQFGKLYQNSN